MTVTRLTYAQIASWVLFAIAVGVAGIVSLELLAAEAIYGTTQLDRHPTLYAIVIVMILNPIIFGIAGLIKTSPQRRTIVAIASLAIVTAYALLAFALLPEFVYG